MWIFATAVFLVLVFFLYRHPRTTLKVIGVVVAVLLVAGAVIYYYQLNSPSTYMDRDSHVWVTVSYDATACSKDHPLRVIISNRADAALEKIEWQMAAFVPGRSSNIAPYQSAPYMSDHIIEPNKMITLCYNTPPLNEPQEPSRLRWEATSRHTSFR
jgi:hypothetical protein